MRTFIYFLTIISIGIIYFGLRLIKDIYKSINILLAKKDSEKKSLSIQKIGYYLTGAFLVIIGAVFYFKIWVNVMNRDVKESIICGITMIMTSLIFTGGMATIESMLVGEKETIIKKMLIGSVVILVAYLVLKGLMILP